MNKILTTLFLSCLFLFVVHAQDEHDINSPEYKQGIVAGEITSPAPVYNWFPSGAQLLKTATVCNPDSVGCVLDFSEHALVDFNGEAGAGGCGGYLGQESDDCSTQEIPLPFTYSVCGEPFESVFINVNGNISFGGPILPFTPEGIPNNLGVFVAPFYGDVDLGLCGSVYFDIQPTHMIVTWDEVGYFSQSCDKLNTFQVVITDGNDPLIGIGKNTAFYYCDMAWTTGSASGGVDGFGGSPATVGINLSEDNFAIIGQFDHPGNDYDGPLGNVDGVDFLDDKFYLFDAANCAIESSCSIFELNVEPDVCDGSTYDLNVSFVPAGTGAIGYIVEVEGEQYGPFPYGPQGEVSSTVIEGLAGTGDELVEVVVYDFEDNFCVIDCEYAAPLCAPACQLGAPEIGVEACDGENFNIVIDFTYEEVGENGFNLSIGGVDQGVFAYEDLPLTFTLPGDATEGIVVNISDVDGPDCTNSSNFDAPLCCGPSAGTMGPGPILVCAGGSAAATNSGAVLETGDILVYALHTSPTAEAGDILAVNSTGVFTQGDAEPNVEYYISAIVGDDLGGGEIDLESECTVIAPGTPVVFLNPVEFVFNEICDWEITGEFELTVAVVGGLPEYDGSTYTVTGTGLASANELPYAAGPIINLGQFNLMTYAYDAIDQNGCTASFVSDLVYCFKTPIELISFEGEAKPAGNLLSWATGTETDNDYFEVLKSEDGLHFEVAATIDGAGNSVNRIDYNHLDVEVSEGVMYYQLRQVDYNGKSSLSDVITIVRGAEDAIGIVSVTPNPTTGSVVLSGLDRNQIYEVKIFDLSGKLVKQGFWNMGEQIDLTALGSGVYILNLAAEGLGSWNLKVIRN